MRSVTQENGVDLVGKRVWEFNLAVRDDQPDVIRGGRGGLFVVDSRDGELLEVFNPGDGICASATLDATHSRLYVLSNGGTLYALDIG